MVDPHLKGYSQVVIASVLFGLIGIFIKLISDMPLGSIIFYRMLFGLAAIAFYLAASGRFNEIRLIEKKRYILLLGLFEAGAVLLYFISVRYTDVSIAVLLLYTAPIYVTLLSPPILKENITRTSLFSLVLSIAGVVIVIQPYAAGMGDMNTIGIFMGLLSGLFYALMIMTSRHLRGYYTGTAQAAWSIIVSLIIYSPYLGAVDKMLDNLYLLVQFGLIPTAIGSILYFNGLRQIRAQHASIIGLLEPVSAGVFAIVILSEPISFTTLLGGGLILLGIAVISRERPDEFVVK